MLRRIGQGWPLWAYLCLCGLAWLVMEKPGRYFWSFLLGALAVACLCVLRRLRRPLGQYACLFLLSLCAASALMEWYLAWKAPASVLAPLAQSSHAAEPGIAPCESNLRPDADLGFALKPVASRTACIRRDGDQTLYDVVYTSRADGWRVTPDRGAAADTAILFFGCSYTYGEGLTDAETFPYRVGEQLGEHYQVFNLAVPGYGAHQTLAMLESGRLDALLAPYKHVRAFFLSLDDHVRRCGGFAPWDRHGPRYTLENDRVARRGNFQDDVSAFRRLADAAFGKSQIYGRLVMNPSPAQRARLEDLHVAMLARIRDLLREKYDASFAVMIWVQGKQFKEPLRAAGLSLLDLDPYFPDFAADPSRYAIPGDGHPNALANAVMAQAVEEYLGARR